MIRHPRLPNNRLQPLDPWDQEEERLGLATPDPARKPRQPIKPLNERLAEAQRARAAELARQPAKLPDSLGQLAPTGQPDTLRRPRLSLPQPHPTQPAVPKTQGGFVAGPEEAEFDYPLITRAVRALTQALGRSPKPGDTIPAEAVEPYLKALTGDRFDKRADADFFRHVEGVYRAAFPRTYIDASGRMIDTPAQAIPFTPFGPPVPRQAQPGMVKASTPARPSEAMTWREAFREVGRTNGGALGVEETRRGQPSPAADGRAAEEPPRPQSNGPEEETSRRDTQETAKPREPEAEFDWRAHWKSDHDGWRGTVRGMAEQSGIDPDLFEEAPPEAEVAFAGAVAYRHMDREQQRAVLQMITELEQGDHKRLAQRLRGYIAEQHSLGGMHHPETLSQKEIAERLEKNSSIRHMSEQAQRFLDDPLLVVPPQLQPHYLVLRGLLELVQKQTQLTDESMEMEMNRRQ